MLSRITLTTCSLLTLASGAFAAGPQLLGQITLDYLNQSSNNGTFEWAIHGTGIDVFTYCFSTNNDFSPGENPQVFNVWTIAGSTAAQISGSGMLSNNYMNGLTSSRFLEAAAQAVGFGTPGITSTDTANNAAIHDTESNGNVAFSGFDNLGVSNFYYLQQANPSSYAYAGQPQGLVGATPPPTQGTPEPASIAAIGIGAVGMLRRRSKRS